MRRIAEPPPLAADDAYGAALAELRRLLAGTCKWHGMPELLDTLDRLRRCAGPTEPTFAAAAIPAPWPGFPVLPSPDVAADAPGRERHVDVMVDA